MSQIEETKMSKQKTFFNASHNDSAADLSAQVNDSRLSKAGGDAQNQSGLFSSRLLKWSEPKRGNTLLNKFATALNIKDKN
jgi:hypothetical protein